MTAWVCGASAPASPVRNDGASLAQTVWKEENSKQPNPTSHFSCVPKWEESLVRGFWGGAGEIIFSLITMGSQASFAAGGPGALRLFFLNRGDAEKNGNPTRFFHFHVHDLGQVTSPL